MHFTTIKHIHRFVDLVCFHFIELSFQVDLIGQKRWSRGRTSTNQIKRFFYGQNDLPSDLHRNEGHAIYDWLQCFSLCGWPCAYQG